MTIETAGLGVPLDSHPGTTMDAALEALLGFAQIFAEPTASVYWGYLASTLGLAMVLSLRSPRERSGLAGMLEFCLPRRIYLARGFAHDLAMMFVNTMLHSYFILPHLLSSLAVTEAVWHGLYHGFGPVASPLGESAAQAGVTIAALLAADCAFFVSHWLHHRVPLLWEFHKVHHSAVTLNPFTTFRRHPVDFAIEGNISGVATGLVFGLFAWLSGTEVDMFTVLGLNAGLFCFFLLGAHLQHSHIWFSYGPVISRVLVSPAMHQIHHSKAPRHYNRNMGNIFSFWDALAGTRYVPRDRESLELGLERDEELAYRGLAQLYLRPFAVLLSRTAILLSPRTEGRTADPVAPSTGSNPTPTKERPS